MQKCSQRARSCGALNAPHCFYELSITRWKRLKMTRFQNANWPICYNSMLHRRNIAINSSGTNSVATFFAPRTFLIITTARHCATLEVNPQNVKRLNGAFCKGSSGPKMEGIFKATDSFFGCHYRLVPINSALNNFLQRICSSHNTTRLHSVEGEFVIVILLLSVKMVESLLFVVAREYKWPDYR